MRTTIVPLALVSLVSLAACGGADDGNSDAPSPALEGVAGGPGVTIPPTPGGDDGSIGAGDGTAAGGAASTALSPNVMRRLPTEPRRALDLSHLGRLGQAKDGSATGRPEGPPPGSVTGESLGRPPAPPRSVPGGGPGVVEDPLAAKGAHRLSGFDPDLPSTDLGAVRDVVGDAEIVGLGESAHASAGFLGLKIRIAKDLIEKGGFRAVTWESARVPLRRMQQYIDTCQGDPGEAAKSLYAIWSDVQTRDFAAWLCQWNQTHAAERVQVHGFDVQDPGSDFVELSDFFHLAAPAESERLIEGLLPCDTGGMSGTTGRDVTACKTGIAEVERYLDDHAMDLSANDLGAAHATARIAITSFAAWQAESTLLSYDASFEARDIGMAKVFEQLRALHFPGTKALIFAHNIHVVKRHETVSQSWVGGPIVTQGTQLDRDLGDGRYRAFAMVGMHVSLNRNGYKGPVSPSPSSSSLEAVLHALGEPALLVDLHAPGVTSLFPAGNTLEMGAPGIEHNVPAENYDGVFYLEESPLAELVP
jgi:erythromycin esterase-like protein